MKVILLQDVAKIGKKHSIVDVPDGYGMNKLVPKGLAKPATPANLKAVLNQQQEKAAATEHTTEAFKAMLTNLADVEVVATATANADGALYEALKKDVLIAAIASAANTPVQAEWVVVHAPIKTTGAHSVTLQCNGESVERSITVVAA